MRMYPEVQSQVHMGLDEVVSDSALLTAFADLPSEDACEDACEDDNSKYEGIFIYKGTVCLQPENMRTLKFHPEVYEEKAGERAGV